MSSSHSSAERIGPVNAKPEAERSAEIEFQSQLAMRFFIAFSMLSNVAQNGSCNLSENLVRISLGRSLAHEEHHFCRDARTLKKLRYIFAHLVLPIRPVMAAHGAPVVERVTDSFAGEDF